MSETLRVLHAEHIAWRETNAASRIGASFIAFLFFRLLCPRCRVPIQVTTYSGRRVRTDRRDLKGAGGGGVPLGHSAGLGHTLICSPPPYKSYTAMSPTRLAAAFIAALDRASIAAAAKRLFLVICPGTRDSPRQACVGGGLACHGEGSMVPTYGGGLGNKKVCALLHPVLVA